MVDTKSNQKSDNKISNTENDTANDCKWYRSVFAWISNPARTNWLIAFCTIVIAITAIIQSSTLKRTNQISCLQDRAFIYFLNPTVFPYPKKKPRVYGITLNIANTGNMPARKVSIKYYWKPIPTSKHVVDPWPFATRSSIEQPSFIGPKQKLSLKGGKIKLETINEVKNSNIDGLVKSRHSGENRSPYHL